MATAGSRCPHDRCDGSGFVIDETTNTAHDCECRAEQIRNRRFLTRTLGHVAPRYSAATLDRPPFLLLPSEMQAPLRQFHDLLETNLSEGRGLWIQGPLHSAKRTAAAAITRRAVALGFSSQMHSLRRFIALSKACIDDASRLSPLKLADKLIELDLLTLAGPIFEPSPFALEQLGLVLDGRWEQQRSLVLVTEQTPEELELALGSAGPWMVSRLHGMCGPPLKLDLDPHPELQAA
jgi:DNA replication protein DnaC